MASIEMVWLCWEEVFATGTAGGCAYVFFDCFKQWLADVCLEVIAVLTCFLGAELEAVLEEVFYEVVPMDVIFDG